MQRYRVAVCAVCELGDIIAVDSPSFHGIMQTLRGFGIRAIEISIDAVTGISLEALELAFDQWPIKAVVVVQNYNNPLGFIMPEPRKLALLALAQRFDAAVIEDDVYRELAWGISPSVNHQDAGSGWPGPALQLLFQNAGARFTCWLGGAGPLP